MKLRLVLRGIVQTSAGISAGAALLCSIVFGVQYARTTQHAIPLGSNEAVTALSFEPNLIDLGQLFKARASSQRFDLDFCFECFSPFSFRNASQVNSYPNGIYDTERMKPHRFALVDGARFPILFNRRGAGYPFFFLRGLAGITSPANALRIHAIVFSLSCLLLGLVAIRGAVESRVATVAALLIAGSPYFAFFFPSWIDIQWALLWTLLFVVFLQRTGRSSGYLAGAALAAVVITKLPFIYLVLPFLVLYQQRLFSKARAIVFAFSALVIPWIALQDLGALQEELLFDRSYVKNVEFYGRGFLLQAIHFFSPAAIFPFFGNSIEPEHSISRILRVSPLTTTLSVIFFTGMLLIVRKELLRHKWLVGSFVLLSGFSLLVARGFVEDTFAYWGVIQLFAVVLLAVPFARSHGLMAKIFLLGFLCARFVSALEWSDQFGNRYDFRPFVSHYEVMAHRLMDMGVPSPLTFYYENLGQFEYFSGEKLTPTHYFWKYSRETEQLDPAAVFEVQRTGYLLWPVQVPERDMLPARFRSLTFEGLSLLARRSGKRISLVEEFDFSAIGQVYYLLHFAPARSEVPQP